MNIKAMLRSVNDKGVLYDCLAFICPGCKEAGGTGLHLLPVNTTSTRPTWEWDGNLERPTIKPSILTKRGVDEVCHSYLTDGKFQFLSDCTHSLANQINVEMPDLPDWFVEE